MKHLVVLEKERLAASHTAPAAAASHRFINNITMDDWNHRHTHMNSYERGP